MDYTMEGTWEARRREGIQINNGGEPMPSGSAASANNFSMQRVDGSTRGIFHIEKGCHQVFSMSTAENIYLMIYWLVKKVVFLHETFSSLKGFTKLPC